MRLLYEKKKNDFLVAFSKYDSFKKITRDILEEFIERIDVYIDGRIEIKVLYMDELKQIQEWIEMSG